MKSWREETWRGRLKMLAFALTPVTIIVLLMEAFTALAIHRQFGVETDALTGRQSYFFHMGRYPWSHKSRTPLNSLGFPDDEFVNVSPKGTCTHVVFAGDSFTFGDGVDRADNYVSLVRTWSARRFPDRCLRFFNIGERATTIEQQARHLDKTWPMLAPDVVILGQYQNDLTDLTKQGFAGHVEAPAGTGQRNWSVRKIRIPIVGTSIVKWLSYRVFALLSAQGIRYDILRQWSVLADPDNSDLAQRLVHQYTEMFDATVKRARARGAAVGVVIIPSKFDVLAGRSPEESLFLELAGERDLPALSLFPTFDVERQPYPFLMYDGHLNAHGNYVVGKAVMSWLFDRDPAPFAALRVTTPEPGARRSPDTIESRVH